jgi:ergothioneine biosynthesis glutamate--cysteine ligase EgtA
MTDSPAPGNVRPTGYGESMTVIDEDQAAGHIPGICLKTGPPRRTGVELEWLVRDVRDPALPVAEGRLAAAVAVFGAARDARDGSARGARDGAGLGVRDGAAWGVREPAGNRVAAGQEREEQNRGLREREKPGRGAPDQGNRSHGAPRGDNADEQGQDRRDGGRRDRPELPTTARPGVLPSGALLTTEPGGQLELSSRPADSLAGLVDATAGDLAALRAALAADGLELAGIGLDPLRLPQRVLTLPRYAAMEEYFDRGGPWGRQMMCGTASVQVCLDAGNDSDGPDGYRWRWRLLHAVGPVLVAAFANSPLRDGKPTGWVSARQQVWTRMDPRRTRPPVLNGDPRAAWASYALDADLMCVRNPDSGDWSAPPGVTLRDWIRAGLRGSGRGQPRHPTASDVEYHLSTLFPPVRPRGHFELRMIDAQRGDGWLVPLAVTTALLSDAAAGEAALAALAALWDGRPAGGDAAVEPWVRAARFGPADPAIGQASRECFAVAREALDRMAVPASITAAVDAFCAQYVSKDRCPADDLLEEKAE